MYTPFRHGRHTRKLSNSPKSSQTPKYHLQLKVEEDVGGWEPERIGTKSAIVNADSTSFLLN